MLSRTGVVLLLMPAFRLPGVDGGGYVHSRLPASQARQGVLTPLLRHLTFDLRHRVHAMELRIFIAGLSMAGF